MIQLIAKSGEFAYSGRADLVLRTTRPALTETTMERRMADPTQARVREYFNFDPETGHLIFRERPKGEFTAGQYAQHLKRVGEPAGCVSTFHGYRKVFLDGKYHGAHRLIWLHVLGEWVKYPEFEIDHVNGNKDDNRIQNLRKCTKSMNQRNGSMRSNNRSGVIGVNWVVSKQRWIARIWDGPHHLYLGQFTDIEEARAVRAKAERELGYHPGHGKPAYNPNLKASTNG